MARGTLSFLSVPWYISPPSPSSSIATLVHTSSRINHWRSLFPYLTALCYVLPASPQPESLLHIRFLCKLSQDFPKCWRKARHRPPCNTSSGQVILSSLLLDLSSHSHCPRGSLHSLQIQSGIQSPPPPASQDNLVFPQRKFRPACHHLQF